MPNTLTIELGDRSYPIVFAADVRNKVRDKVTELTAAGRKVAVFTDEQVASAQVGALEAMFGSAPRLAFLPGESAKSLASFGRAMDFLAAQKVDRRGVVFAFGGGVIGDLAGFIAASWLRGIDFYQVPTTLLAMVDSSVGGKTGINIPAGKNLVGAFHQPRGVFIGTDFLRTLPAREFAAGMAEVIKYGLLGDATLLELLERAPLGFVSPELAEVIRQCCALKATFVQADERELAPEGGRALLNLGHTFGHAIEQVTGYGVYLHGEAVAIGMCAAARLSAKLGHLGGADVVRVEAVIAAHRLPVKLRTPLALTDLLAAMARDKKVRAGMPRFVVLRKLGDAATQEGVSAALAAECFREVGAS